MGKRRKDEKFDRPKAGAPEWANRLFFALETSPYTKDSISQALGVGTKTIQSWTTGRTEMTYANLARICDLTGASADWILRGLGLPPIQKQPTEK